MSAQNLTERAMLVSLNISQWSARKHDKKITAEVAAKHQTHGNCGNYHKRLLPQDAASYNAIVTAAGAARTDHYANTLPWADDGCRILTAENFLSWAGKMRQHQAAFDLAVSDFARDYPSLREDARVMLNGLWSAADYPEASEIPRRFKFGTSVLPLPSAQDFRVQLGAEQEEAIRAEIEAHVNATTQAAMGDAFSRLSAALGHLQERLATPGAIFRNTLFTNLEELVEVLPRLNLTGDPSLTAVTERVRREILGACTPDAARQDPAARAQAAAKADAILAQMQGLYR